jgi:capsular exopolysaccharide synthesis family protein
VPRSPISPRTKLNIALGLLVGLAVGVGAAVLFETLDTRIKTLDGYHRYFDLPVLATIGFDAEAAKKPLITSLPSHSKRAESFKQLRTNLQFTDVDNPPQSIAITSAIPKEGKSTTAVNLAITMAQAGHLIILVEGDLRRPKVADYLGIEGSAGLTDVLVGRATVDRVLQPWGLGGNLWVLPAGPQPPNPAELVGSQTMVDLIHDLEQRAFVIIDAPPLLPVTDGAILAGLSGGAVIVLGAGHTRREQLRAAEESIANVDGRVLGLVFNRAPTKGPDAARYGYGYAYEGKGKGKSRNRAQGGLGPTSVTPAAPLVRPNPGQAPRTQLPEPPPAPRYRADATDVPVAAAANGNGSSNGSSNGSPNGARPAPAQAPTREPTPEPTPQHVATSTPTVPPPAPLPPPLATPVAGAERPAPPTVPTRVAPAAPVDVLPNAESASHLTGLGGGHPSLAPIPPREHPDRRPGFDPLTAPLTEVPSDGSS